MRPRGLWFMLCGIGLLATAALIFWRAMPSGFPADFGIVGDAAAGLDRAANSPALAVDPLNHRVLLLAERIDRPGFSCALYRSADGGEHWNPVRVPVPPRYDTCYAPDVLFDRRGNAALMFLTLNTHPKDPLSAGNDPNGAWLTRSGNGGQTFEAARRVLGPDHIQVRIAADPSSNRLYLLWLEGSDLENHTPLGLGPAPNPLKISVSNDGGRTFSAPAQVNAAKHLRVGAASMAIADDGTVNVLFEDFRGDLNDYNNRALPFQGTFSLLLARSSNHGASFVESVVDNHVVRTAPFLIYLPPLPAVAVDATGKNIYAAWQDGRGGAPDILFRHSSDSGKTWSALARLNQRGADASEALLPALSASADGRLDAVFLDARPVADTLATNVMYVQSKDGGASFTPPTPLTRRPFDGFVGALNPRTQAIDLGTRLALRSTPEHVRAAWPDSRLGTPDTGRQEIAFANIAVPQGIAQVTSALEHSAETAPPVRPPQMEAPNPAKPCRGRGPRAIFVAYEAASDELAGLRYFVSDWDTKKHCFTGRVVTNSAELAKSDYDVAIIDVSRNMTVPQKSVDDIARAMRRGKPVALFMQPADLGTQSDAPERVVSLRRIFPGLTMTRTCANSQFTNVTGGPFDLTGRSFHYESFVHGVYDLGVSGPSTSWAVDLCKTRKPTVVRTPRGIVAGFYLAYEVSLADNNAPAITAKRLVVNVIHELARQ